MSQDLTAKTVSGISWSAISAVGERVIASLTTLVLARFLLPSAYGLLAMATVLTAFFATIKDLGTYSALVRRNRLSDDLVSTAFWINLLWGVVGTAIVAILAPLVARFYHEPRVTALLAFLSLSLFLNSLGLVHRAMMVRAMSFRRLAFIQVGSAMVAAAAGIVLAIRGAGVWSLVAMFLIDASLESLLLWIASPWRPRWYCSWSELHSIRSFSLNLTGSNILDYFSRNADNLLVGRYLGVVPLGYYSFAYGLMMLPIQNISWVVGKVVFPAFSHLGEDNAHFRKAFLRVCTKIGTLTFPMMLGMLVTADVLVTVMLGGKWLPAVPLVRILAPVGMLQSLSSMAGIIYLTKGRSELRLRWAVIADVSAVMSFAVGLRWGISGVATAYALVVALLAYPNLSIPLRLIQMPLRALAAALWPSFKAALWMSASVLLVRAGLEFYGVKPSLVLAIAVFTGVAVYGGLLLWQRPPVLQDLARILPWNKRDASRTIG
jgi:PST family polysaccharide transporter